MQIIEKVEHLAESKELVVVIDVIRAFTTAAFAFAKKRRRLTITKQARF